MAAWATGGSCARGHVTQQFTCSTGGISVLSHRTSFGRLSIFVLCASTHAVARGLRTTCVL